MKGVSHRRTKNVRHWFLLSISYQDVAENPTFTGLSDPGSMCLSSHELAVPGKEQRRPLT
jgi:hypothetical protein